MSVLVGQTRNVGGQLYVEFQLLQSPCKSCYHIYPTASRISWDMVKVLVGHYLMTDPYFAALDYDCTKTNRRLECVPGESIF